MATEGRSEKSSRQGSTCPERLCRSRATSSSDFANSAGGGSMSAKVHSEADRKRNSLGGIEGFRSSMCTLPRQVERCTVLGPEPQGETVLPLKEVIIHQSEKCNNIFCAAILKAHAALRAMQDEGGCSQRRVTEIVA